MPSVRIILREHILILSILLFIAIFSCIWFIKPSCFYNQNGSIREFGIGYKNKTIFPIWLFSLLLGLCCYLAFLYYIQFI